MNGAIQQIDRKMGAKNLFKIKDLLRGLVVFSVYCLKRSGNIFCG
jgi:hypothetical protein